MNPGRRYAFPVLVRGNEHFSTASLRQAALATLMLAGCAPSLSAAQTFTMSDAASPVQLLASRHTASDVDMMDSVLEVAPPTRAARADAVRSRTHGAHRHVARRPAFGMNTAPIRDAGEMRVSGDRPRHVGGAMQIDSMARRSQQASRVSGARMIEGSDAPRAAAMHDVEPDPWSSAWFAPREVTHGAALHEQLDDAPFSGAVAATSSSRDDWTQLSAAQSPLGTMNDRVVW